MGKKIKNRSKIAFFTILITTLMIASGFGSALIASNDNNLIYKGISEKNTDNTLSQTNDDTNLLRDNHDEKSLTLENFNPTGSRAQDLTFYTTTSDGQVGRLDPASNGYNYIWSNTVGQINNSYDRNWIGQAYIPLLFYYFYISRGFFFFDTSFIPDDATITTATLSLYGFEDTSAQDFNLVIQNGQPTYPHDPLQVGDYYKNYYSGNGGSLSTASWITSGYNVITLNTNGKSWINKAGYTKLCVRSDRDISGTAPTTSETVGYWSKEKGTSYCPRLYVAFTTPNPIHANFTWVANGLTVTFTDTSTGGGGLRQCAWDFTNDGVDDAWTAVATYTYPSSGTYNCDHWVKGMDYSESSIIKTITVPPPQLSYSPSTINFGSHPQGWTGSSTFQIWNSGGGTLTYTISESISWITVSPTSGSSTGEHDTITVNVVNTGSMNGYYSGTISISSNGGSGSVFVDITINPPPPVTVTFQTDPTNGGTITFNGVTYSNGQSVSVNTGTYSITANPATNYQFSYWSSTCGSVSNPNAQSTTVAVSTTGILKAYFIFVQPPQLAYSPNTLNFGSHSQGWTGSLPFEIWNSGGGTLTYTISESISWITVSPTSGSSTGEHDTITVTASTGTMTPGYYSGTISISSNGGSGSVFVDITVTPPAPDNWTVMVYLDADNNLEQYGIDDFLEMSSTLNSNTVNIVVQFDRIPGYDARYDDWTSTKRYLVTQGMTPTIANALSDIGEKNMGDPATLIDFVNWAKTNYPANRYCLILWDHGDGWRKSATVYKDVCNDYTSGDSLSMAELRSALNTITNGGTSKISLLLFDACLMQMIEVGYEVRSYVEYITGSEEVVPSFGMDYDATLAVLKGTPSMLPQTLGAQFVSDYIASGGTTLSTINCGLLNDLRSDVSSLGSALRNNLYKPGIYNAIMNVETYYDNDFVDLYHFAQLIQANINNQNVKNLAQAVMNQIGNVVTSENHDSTKINSHGISIYVPWLSFDQSYKNLLFAQDSQWDEFLAWYYKGPNQPPNKPIDPSPTDGATGVSTNPILSVLVIDPDGDTMNVSFFESNGTLIGNDTNVGNNTRASVTWAGLAAYTEYSWYAVASDLEDSNQSDTWNFTTGEAVSNPPETPQRPSGPQFGGIGKTYSYITSTKDPDGDQVYYMWDWGDGTIPVWVGPYESEEMVSCNHTWTSIGFFQIKVKAKDTSGAESDWSPSLPIIMPKIAPIVTPFFEWLFEHFPHAFPILRHLLGY